MFSLGRKAGGAGRPGGRNGMDGLSFIGSDMVVSGDILGAGQVHVDGRIDGNVRCDRLVQGDGGTIAGNIIADTAHLAGLVDGTVKARLVTLEPSARVTGDVTYETLSIAAGAAIEGRLTRQDAVASAAAEPTKLEPLNAEPAPEPRPKRMARGVPKAEEPGLLPVTPAPAAAATAG